MTTAPSIETGEPGEELIYCGKANCPGSTGLRCIRTDVPICTKCAVLVKGVGYISKDAARTHEKKFYNASSKDYMVAAAIAFFLMVFIGFPFLAFFGGLWFLSIFAGPAVGALISESVWRVVHNRRGKYMARVVTGAMVIASLFLLLLVGFSGFRIFSTLIFSALAISSAAARFEVGLRV